MSMSNNKKVLEILKVLRNRIEHMIKCMIQGNVYNPMAIDGPMVDLLFKARDELVLEAIEDNTNE